MTAAERKIIQQLINELKADVADLKNELSDKVDAAVKSVKDAFEGFGILDPDVDTWTGKEVCERYGVSERFLYDRRKDGTLPFIKVGPGKNSKIRYRKADVIELFASRDR